MSYKQVIGPDGKPMMVDMPDSGGGASSGASAGGGGGGGGGGGSAGGGRSVNEEHMFHVGIHSDVTAGIEAAMGAGVLDRIFGNLKMSGFQLGATVRGFQLPGVQCLLLPKAHAALKGQKNER